MSYSFSTGRLTLDLGSTYFESTSDSLTLAAWVKYADHPGGTGNQSAVVQVGASSTVSASSALIFLPAVDGDIRAVEYNTSTSLLNPATYAGGANYGNGVWLPIVATFTRDAATATTTTSRSIYAGAIGQTQTNTNDNTVDPLQFVSVGGIFNNANWFAGNIAEVAIWDGLLTTQNITDYLAGYRASGISAANLLAYYSLYSGLTQTGGTLTLGSMGTAGTAPQVDSGVHPTILEWTSKYLKLETYADDTKIYMTWET